MQETSYGSLIYFHISKLNSDGCIENDAHSTTASVRRTLALSLLLDPDSFW